MFETCADLTRVQAAIGYTPKTSLETGLGHFVAWFKKYYRL
jgi:UDP-glucuronate 4-epimerase